MNADINLWLKVAVVALANLIGVYVVKFIEEKKRKRPIIRKIQIYNPGFPGNSENVDNLLLTRESTTNSLFPPVINIQSLMRIARTQKEKKVKV